VRGVVRRGNPRLVIDKIVINRWRGHNEHQRPRDRTTERAYKVDNESPSPERKLAFMRLGLPGQSRMVDGQPRRTRLGWGASRPNPNKRGTSILGIKLLNGSSRRRRPPTRSHGCVG
jgi:hypothetical protein